MQHASAYDGYGGVRCHCWRLASQVAGRLARSRCLPNQSQGVRAGVVPGTVEPTVVIGGGGGEVAGVIAAGMGADGVIDSIWNAG